MQKLDSIKSEQLTRPFEVLVSLLRGSLVQRVTAWIGGYKTSTGAWAWKDGSVFAYSNWASGEPNGVAPQSIMMYGRGGSEAGRWNDEAPRTRITGYVCSYCL